MYPCTNRDIRLYVSLDRILQKNTIFFFVNATAWCTQGGKKESTLVIHVWLGAERHRCNHLTHHPSRPGLAPLLCFPAVKLRVASRTAHAKYEQLRKQRDAKAKPLLSWPLPSCRDAWFSKPTTFKTSEILSKWTCWIAGRRWYSLHPKLLVLLAYSRCIDFVMHLNIYYT